MIKHKRLKNGVLKKQTMQNSPGYVELRKGSDTSQKKQLEQKQETGKHARQGKYRKNYKLNSICSD